MAEWSTAPAVSGNPGCSRDNLIGDEKLKKEHKPNPRRLELMQLSAAVRPLVKNGVYSSMNEAIMAQYITETGFSEWHTFADWRKQGRPVKKGERGFPIWAQPRRLKAEGAAGDLAQVAALNGIEPQGAEFFPVCYLFHAGQVEAAQLEAA